jgi:pimeloyl-ACP methyl ester carboxylesterase
VISRSGHEPATGLYYEVLGDGDTSLLMIPGGGATGACWRATPDGRRGLADQLADSGRRIWVTDWPGLGRSGARSPTEIEYADVVDGYRRLLCEVIAEPVVVLCHSMGGAIAWQLVAHESELVTGVVSVAGAYPGNVVARSEVLADDGRVIVVRFADTGVEFTVDRQVPYFYEDAYIREQAIADSSRFPPGAERSLRAGLVAVPPRMLLQRLGVLGGMPGIDDPVGFAGKPIRLIAGDCDPAHTREIEVRTVGLLRSWGAEAELVWLADLGIEGNGHFPFLELNSDQVLAVAAEAVAAVGG